MLDEIAADKDADGFHPLYVGALAMRGSAPAAGPFLRIFSPPCAAAPPPPVPSSDRELPWTVSASCLGLCPHLFAAMRGRAPAAGPFPPVFWMSLGPQGGLLGPKAAFGCLWAIFKIQFNLF